MTNHQIHAALARQRGEEISRHAALARLRDEEISRYPHSPRPRREWADVAPVVSVVAGFLGLLALAAPSL